MFTPNRSIGHHHDQPLTPPALRRQTPWTPRARSNADSPIMFDRSMLGSYVELPLSLSHPFQRNYFRHSPPFSSSPLTTPAPSFERLKDEDVSRPVPMTPHLDTPRPPDDTPNLHTPGRSPRTPEVCEFADQATCHAIVQDGLGIYSIHVSRTPLLPPQHFRSHSDSPTHGRIGAPLKRYDTGGSLKLLACPLRGPFSRSTSDLLTPTSELSNITPRSPDYLGWRVPDDWREMEPEIERRKEKLGKKVKRRIKEIIGKLGVH